VAESLKHVCLIVLGTPPLNYLRSLISEERVREHRLLQVRIDVYGQTGPIGKNTTLSSHCPVALDDVWAERSEPAPRSLSSFPVVRAGEDDVLPA